MAYNSLNKAHTHHAIHTEDSSDATAYNRYQTGVIAGRYRDVPAVIADESGFDGLGFDSTVDSEDDRWHMVNIFKQGGHYIDSLAIGGAYDEHQAMQVANTQLDYLGGDYCKFVTDSQNVQFDDLSAATVDTWSIDAVNKLMDNPSQDQYYLPTVTAQELVTETERVTFDSVQWDRLDNLVSHGGKGHLLSLDLIRADTRNELVTPFVLADELRDTNAVAASFDALMDTASRLPLLKDRLFRAMASAGKGSDVTVENVTQTKDFKRQGVINSAFVFDLSDGQTLSIWFHNPDSTPSKLMPSDIMISWKWMLNKRDVTAALSPKNGDNVQLPALAKRILHLATTNSKRFQSTQARNAKVSAELDAAQKDVDDKHTTIEQLDTDIEGLQFQLDTRMKAAATKAAATPSPDDVNNNDDLPSLTVDNPPARPTNGSITEGNISVGDPIVWRTENNTGNVNEIKGTFKSFMDHQGELRVFFMSEGSQLNAPQNEVFADTDAPAATDDTPAELTQMAKLDALSKLAPKTGEAIKSDDPDAIKKLESKLAYLQARASMMRTTNKHLRKDDDAALTAMGFTDKTIAALKEPDYAGRAGFVDYQMSNNNGEIGRVKKRLKKLHKERDLEAANRADEPTIHPPVEYQGDGIYIAYKNDLKKDTWSASQREDGEWVVTPNNAATRSFPDNVSPSIMGNIALLIQKFPAFKGIEALIAQNIATDTDTTDYTADYTADFDAYTVTVTEGENVGKTYSYAEIVKSPELQDRFNNSVFPFQGSRIDNINDLLVDGNGWELRSEFEGDDELDGVIKEGVEAIPTLNSNTPPAADGIPPEQDYYDRLIVWTVDNTSLKFVDDLSLSDKAVADMIEKSYATNDENKTADDVTEPTPTPEPTVPAKSLADRIAVVMDNVTSKDFDPTSIDTDALLGLVDEAEDDAALTAEIETLTKIYQRKLVEISMKALASLADDV